MLVAVLAVVFFLVPFAEIFVIVKMSAVFGNVNTVLLMVVLSSAGAWLVKREGLDAWRKVTAGVRAGRIPTAHVIDSFVLMAAGVLLLTPGFITGVIGLLLTVPPVREVVGVVVTDRFKSRFARRHSVVDAAHHAARPTSPFHGPRAYQRPEEAAPAPPPGSPRTNGSPAPTWSRDIIDVEGEEWYLDEKPLGEIGPAGG